MAKKRIDAFVLFQILSSYFRLTNFPITLAFIARMKKKQIDIQRNN